MYSVMLSIQPKWCELIANGEKTIEIRKTKPKLETPFKCYIYCTKAKKHFSHNGIREAEDELYRLPDGKIKFGYSGELMLHDDYDENNFLNGKVIGEFMCDNVDMFYYGVQTPCDATSYFDCYKGYSEELYQMEESHCITKQEINNYGNNSTLYAWHISDLVIYDKPKKLSEFYHNRSIQCMSTEFNIEGVTHYPVKRKIIEPIIRPPQSWCYCKVLANG